MENLMLWGFYILTFYAFLPGLISRTFGFRVFKRGRADREIALTFDDGPDPKYTPLLLNLLAKYNAKATFFVVGANAEKHPELLRRMKDEGHVIGIHNYVHKSNWVMRPKEVRRQIYRTSEIIRDATGLTSVFYRPPWGIVNLFDFSRLGYLQIILWSAMFGDWRTRLGAERLTKRMLKKLRPGEVLLLHDCGTTLGADEGAPANMLRALESYMLAGQEKGYRFVTIQEMIDLTDQALGKQPRAVRQAKPGLAKRLLIGLWLGWERLFHLLFRLVPVKEGGGMFHYRIRTYHGQTLQLPEGQQIASNDKIVELHFDNKRLLEVMRTSKSLVQVAIIMIREVEKALPGMAQQLAARRELGEVRGIYGISMINRGSENFGFTVLDLPKGIFSRLTQVYLKLLLSVLHPTGLSRLKDKRSVLSPKIMAMSMKEFNRRYVSKPPNEGNRPESASSAEAREQLQPVARDLSYNANKTAKELIP
ncbi:polysaccharide deacetylase family protein [Paenibacillus sp. SYP-B4298]|uniref:polysaccharide deacetylase family protein n=1 Tax=Paenibacillus sp. SYP-B4298 TaxID=2996034 RepID=UPI0022DE2BAD|nr:polysaccharide deacetylase family protein [Paenibacillus sp. SYP-B4298]